MVKGRDPGAKVAEVPIPAVVFTSSVTLSQFFNLSTSQAPDL